MKLTALALQHPRWVDAGIRLDRVRPLSWLGLQASALLPIWVWMVARLRDGSDDPLGLLALAALAVLVWQRRRDLRAAPRLGWLALAALGTMAATLLHTGELGLPALPPLLSALLAVLALACGPLAFLPREAGGGTRHAPVVGLAVLSLPLLSSLQFYAGYPLRLLTAELSRWVLAPFFTVEREGTSLWINGHLVIVDAPCSGVQMVWLGYFTACAMALFIRPLDDRRFLARLPAVSALVLFGNIVRNSVLVGLEGAGRPLPTWAHEGLGLLMLAAVCGGIAWAMGRGVRQAADAAVAVIPGRITTEGTHHADRCA